MTTAIKSRLVIDGTGGEPIRDGVVLVEGERIKAVGRQADLGIPDGAEVIDLGDETVPPGFVDAHTHISANPDTSLRLCLAAGVDAIEHAVPQTDEQIELYLKSGAAFVRTYTIGFQSQTDWAWFAGKDIAGRVEVMRQIVKDSYERPRENP